MKHNWLPLIGPDGSGSVAWCLACGAVRAPMQWVLESIGEDPQNLLTYQTPPSAVVLLVIREQGATVLSPDAWCPGSPGARIDPRRFHGAAALLEAALLKAVLLDAASYLGRPTARLRGPCWKCTHWESAASLSPFEGFCGHFLTDKMGSDGCGSRKEGFKEAPAHWLNKRVRQAPGLDLLEPSATFEEDGTYRMKERKDG